MKALTCAATRRRLQAFHDEELPFTDQIAVSAHLEWCDDCAAALAELRALRTALHALAPGRVPLPQEEAAAFTTTVVSRLKAEDDASLFVARARDVRGHAPGLRRPRRRGRHRRLRRHHAEHDAVRHRRASPIRSPRS